MLVHERGYLITAGPDGGFGFCRPDGTPVESSPPLPPPEGAIGDCHDADVTPETIVPTWYGERLKDLFAEANKLGMTHVAMTDHGNMFAAAEFHRQATGAGVTPVIGIEAYVAPGARNNPDRILWGQPHQKKDDVSASGAYLHK